MEVYKNEVDIKREISSLKKAGKTIALVPTMGALHAGHLSLVKKAKEVADICVVSVFVNPTQFNNSDDLDKYPRDLEGDNKLLEKDGADLVYAPNVNDIYPDSFVSKVTVTKLTEPMEGKFRPGHFDGVTTIVNILFNITTPDFAVFGEKDFQQLRVIETMVADLKMSVKIVRGELIREESGLALSSRNQLLSHKGKKDALILSNILHKAKEIFQNGESRVSEIRKEASKMIEGLSYFDLEYLEFSDSDLCAVNNLSEGDRIFIVGYVEGVRLIDNIGV